MDVSFDLERFRWVEEGRLEVVGRWTGLRGRRGRPVLNVGGRRVSGQVAAEDPWRALFAYDGDPGAVEGAELELGRIVVDLPRPRRLRRRATSEGPVAAGDLGAALAKAEALREDLAASQAEAAAARSELEAARAELEAARGQPAAAAEGDDSELAALRIAHGSLRASHEQLEDELEELRGVREERDRLTGELEQLRSAGADEERAKADLGDLIRQLQERVSESDAARQHLMGELTQARDEIAALRATLDARDAELADVRADAATRLEAERAATTEVHSRLAGAREEAQRTVAAEAEETERLRRELDTAREDAERLLAAERAEVARLREELISRDGASLEDDATRRMVERIERDLDRERATARDLRRQLDDVRSETARRRREESNGVATIDDRAVRTPEGKQRRLNAARAASARRVPNVPPSPASLWAVRVVAALIVAGLGVALVILLSAIT